MPMLLLCLLALPTVGGTLQGVNCSLITGDTSNRSVVAAQDISPGSEYRACQQHASVTASTVGFVALGKGVCADITQC